MLSRPAGGIAPITATKQFLARLDAPLTVLVAVSGGSDSTGLVVALARAAGGFPGIEIVAASVDHGLRAESAAEIDVVAGLCAGLGIRHFRRRWDGEKPVTGILAAARLMRYRLLVEMAGEAGADLIVTGHTFDDQQETVAMRAARRGDALGIYGDGAGLAGMAGAVLLSGRVWLMRPFLDCRRADIRAFLSREGFGWVDDPSNLDPKYERIRLRLGGQGRLPLAVSGEDAQARRAALSGASAAWLRRHASLQHGVLARIAPPGLLGDAAVIGYGLWRLAAVLGGRVHMLSSQSRARVMDFLMRGAAGRISAGRVVFELAGGGLYLTRENRALRPLSLNAGESAVWDGRFSVANRSGSSVTIGAGPAMPQLARRLFTDAPGPAAQRALAAMPHADLPGVSVTPVLSPFSQFLGACDLDLAIALSSLFELPSPPPLRARWPSA